MIALGLLSATPAQASEEDLARQLAAILRAQGPAEGARLLVVPPPAMASPLPPAEIERLMARIATAMVPLARGRLDVLPDAGSVRQALASAYARDGLDGWEQAIARLGGAEADVALLAEATVTAEGLALRLRLLDLRGGRMLGETGPLALAPPPAPAADPGTAFAAAMADLVEQVPQARAGLAIAPFENATTGIVTAAGHYLAGLARDAWLLAANTGTDRLRGAPPARAQVSTSEPGGYRLTGRVWLVDATRSQIDLALSRDGADLASARLDIATARLPPRIRTLLDPAARQPERGFAPLLAAATALGAARLEMTLGAAANRPYTVCADTSPAAVGRCDRLEIELRAGRPGRALCLALGEDGAFDILAPAAHYGAPEVGPGGWTRLPAGLPPGPGGGPVVWFAQGDPGAVLLACALYETEPDLPLAALARLSGRRLDPAEVQGVADILRDSAPLAVAHGFASLLAPDAD